MITKAKFSNFKALRSVEVDLEQFTVLIGPNASGKSTILSGLQSLLRLMECRPAEAFDTETPGVLHSRGGEDVIQLSLEGRGDKGPFSLEFVAPPQQENLKRPPEQWRASIRAIVGKQVAGHVERWEAIEYQPPFSRLEQAKAMGSVALLRLDAARLAAPSPFNPPLTRLAADGTGLGTVIAELASSRPAAFRQFRDACRQIVPSVEEIRTTTVELNETQFEEVQIDNKAYYRPVTPKTWARQLILDMKGAPAISASAASEGTLIVLGIMTALHAENPPNLILIENLEHGLHPTAAAELISQIRRILATKPEVQIVATSHNPYLVDHLQPEEVRLTFYDPNAGTICVPLTAHPDFERWKDVMAPREFWSSVGEKWVQEVGAKQGG